MSLEALQSFLALAIGFSFAGLMSTGYQLVAARPASFGMLQRGPSPAAFAAVPFLVFAAPFIIMRTLMRAGRRRAQRFELVMMATVIAGFWSLMSGTVVVMAVEAIGGIRRLNADRSPIAKRRGTVRASSTRRSMAIYELDGEKPELPGARALVDRGNRDGDRPRAA